MSKAAAARMAELAPFLRELRPSPNATISYDLFADALWWSDERPEDGYGFDRMRSLLHYRTSIILGQRPVRFDEEEWNAARRLFPEWPGFDPRRSVPEHRSLLESFRAEAERSFEELEGEMAEFDEE
jgi:hypothetical protein